MSGTGTKITLIALVGALVLFVVVLPIVGVVTYMGLYNKDLGFATRLTAQYLMNQNDLSEFISGYNEMFGVYAYTLDGLDTYMVDAVKGRYDIRDGAGNPTGTIDAGLFINVIVEAYPDTAGITEIAQRLMDYIAAQRAEFKNNQDKLLDMLRAYDNWRLGMPQNIVLRVVGTPSDNLMARIGDKKYVGQEALDQMYKIVLASDAKKAFESGEMEPLTPPSRDNGK